MAWFLIPTEIDEEVEIGHSEVSLQTVDQIVKEKNSVGSICPRCSGLAVAHTYVPILGSNCVTQKKWFVCCHVRELPHANTDNILVFSSSCEEKWTYFS